MVVSSVVTNTPLRCPSAQWATATQPAGVPPGSPAGAVGGHRLASSDRPIRRSEPAHPGDLLRLDLNKLDPIPTWRPPPPRRRDQPRQPWRRQVQQAAMRTCAPRSDDHSVPGRRRGLDDERAPTCARLWRRPRHWFALRDASITGVLSDMGRRPKPRVRGGAGPDRRAPQPTRPCATDQRQHGAAQPHPARPGVTSRRQNSGPVDRAAPPRTTKGGCYARAKRAKTGVVGDRGVSSVGMWPTSKGHVSSTTSWSAASCCSPSLGCSTTART